MTNFVKIMNKLINLPINEYVLKYLDFWIENNESNINYDEEIFFENKNNKKYKSLYIVNKFIQNGNLIDYFNSLKLFNFNFTENFYWDIIFEMMCGVLFIHKMNYIHFDIKPTNFLVDENGKIILNDFCLSRPTNDFDSFEEIEGDSIYMSLEVFKKNNISQKSDLFSLGLSIFEILTDFKLPKNGDLWQEIRYNKIPDNLLNLIKFTNINFKNLILILTNVNSFNRVDIENIFNDNNNFPELYCRYVLLNKGNYIRNFNPSLCKEFNNEKNYDFTNLNLHNAFTKRSNSMKMDTNSFNK
jgi:serine/threonine protein kinase